MNGHPKEECPRIMYAHWKSKNTSILLSSIVSILRSILCITQGDVKKLTDDVAALKPSLFVAVPRVLERIQSGIVAKLKKKPWIVRFIFNIAYKLKSSAVRGGKPVEKVSSSST